MKQRLQLWTTSSLMSLMVLVVTRISGLTAQDLLRNQRLPVQQSQQQQQQQQQQVNSLAANPLANIQLPPQLASLTPQQLHQLAQLREIQLQQEAAQRQQQQQQPSVALGAPSPIGIPDGSLQPTTQPATQTSGQIPQPTTASSVTETSERHDSPDNNGAYNEGGSEMEGVLQGGAETVSTSGEGQRSSGTSANAASSSSGNQPAGPPAGGAPTFEVNWNKCPQLEPSEGEKSKKTQVITKCLQSAPIPTNLTRENVETHREQIATCALRVEGWFDDRGNYKYDKAETEIRAKKLEPAIEVQVLKFHIACKEEASKKFPREQNKLIDQVQFYQACMDYYISIVCEIEVSVDQ